MSYGPYCKRADVETVLSRAGVTAAIDDDGDGLEEADDQAKVDDAIARASETVAFYVWQKYTDAVLMASRTAQDFSSILAAYWLRGRRGNPVAETLADWADEVTEKLEAVADGRRLLPSVPLKRALAPAWDNTRTDPLRFNFRVIRVERGQSSRMPNALPANTDFTEAFSPEI